MFMQIYLKVIACIFIKNHSSLVIDYAPYVNDLFRIIALKWAEIAIYHLLLFSMLFQVVI